ncbi:MAG: hypothetical protein OXU61_10670 [Gammaproteobacteria bacterium]|nr:hypothetical protein [Gammaproteobacteria bacterium]
MPNPLPGCGASLAGRTPPGVPDGAESHIVTQADTPINRRRGSPSRYVIEGKRFPPRHGGRFLPPLMQ